MGDGRNVGLNRDAIGSSCCKIFISEIIQRYISIHPASFTVMLQCQPIFQCMEEFGS
jgi:hypothetical protein